jgi:hypothetical protein
VDRCAEGGAFNKTLEARERLPAGRESDTRTSVLDIGAAAQMDRAKVS